MSVPPKSLNLYAPWRAVLEALDAPVDMSVLPAIVRCPACQEPRLHVYADTVLGGQWAHCHGCQFAGDMIELAAHFWQMKISDTISKLGCKIPVPPSSTERQQIARYLRDHVRYRARLRRFWRLAQQRSAGDDIYSVSRLLRSLRANATTPGGPPSLRSQIVGIARRSEVKDLFQPCKHRPRQRTTDNGETLTYRGGRADRNGISCGDDRKNVLVVPFCDLPGRICGFLTVGRDTNTVPGDVEFHAANYGHPSRMKEAGLSMWPVLDLPRDVYLGDALFVITDPFAGLSLQLQHLTDCNQRPLPILLSYAGSKARTHAALEQLVGRKTIFCGSGPEVFRQAKVADSLVSTFARPPTGVTRRYCDHSPKGWLEKMQQEAKPWRQALFQRIQQTGHETATELLEYMDFTLGEIRELWHIVPEELRDRFLQVQPFRLALHRVRVDNHEILDSGSGWHLERTGEQICDSPIRIEEILRASDGRVYERGNVMLDGRGTSFTVPRDAIRRDGLFAAISDHLVQHGHRPLVFQRRLQKVADQICYQLYRPTVVRDADRIGWNEDRQAFLFPGFSIMKEGSLRKGIRALVLDEAVPAANLEPNEHLPDGAAEVLSVNSPEVAVTWAVAACIVHNLLARPLAYESAGILLDGAGAEEIGQLAAEALGCIAVDARPRQYAERPIEWLEAHVPSMPGRAGCVYPAVPVRN